MENRYVLRTLFVDDDELLLRAFKRSVDTFCDDCIFEFANSGLQALEMLASKPFDIIVTDLRMPGMDGIELLGYVKDLYPNLLRIVFSGNVKDASALELVELAHQVVAKPVNLDTLASLIQRAIRAKQFLSNPQLLKIIHSTYNIPSVPAIYHELMDALNDERVDSATVGRIISKDPAMTVKILQLVNSAFFGIPGKINSPERAAAYLGIHTIRALILGSHLFSSFESKYAQYFSITTYWDHALNISVLAKQLANDLGMNYEDQETALVAGIIHDIGALVMLDFEDYRTQVQNAGKPLTVEEEYQLWGVSHAEVGAYLLGIWGFQIQVIEAVALHHWPRSVTNCQPDLVTVLHCANGIYEMQKANDTHLTSYLNQPYIAALGMEDQITRWEARFAIESIQAASTTR